MPAVPPINPQLLMALAQKFGGIAPVVNPGFGTPGINPNARTPPGYGGGGMAQRGEVLGRPTMPTPGAPRTMPPSLGETLGTVTPKPAAQRGAKTTYDPDGGYTEEDNDGTKRVFDKDNKLIDTIIPPGSPGAGTWQPPAEAKKPGIWDRLTDPSLAGIALAAGQQMTRARYPGESGIGNAVNAVTAGYNTLAQQRQMQVARELAEREWKAKQDKAAIDKLKSEQEIAESKSRQQKIKDEAEDAKGKRNQARQDAAVREMEAIDKGNTARRTAETAQQNADSLKAQREHEAQVADQNILIKESELINARENLKRLKEQGAETARIRDGELKVHQGQLGVAQANSARMASKETNEKFLPFLKEAGDDIAARERNAVQAAYNANTTYQPPSQADHDKAVNELAMKRYREAQRMQGKSGFEEPPNPLGPDIIPPPPGPAVRGPAAQPWQGVGPPAPSAAPPRGTPNIMVNPKTGQRIMLDERTNQWVPAP